MPAFEQEKYPSKGWSIWTGAGWSICSGRSRSFSSAGGGQFESAGTGQLDWFIHADQNNIVFSFKTHANNLYRILEIK